MINLSNVQTFVDNAEALEYEYGNCGRKIRRFIGRHFVNGAARFNVIVPYAHLLQFAHELGQMQWATEMAQTAMSSDFSRLCDGGTFKMKFGIESVNQAAGTFDIVVTPDVIPDGVVARQKFLMRVAFGLRRYLAMAAMTGGVDNLDDFFQDMFGMPGSSEKVNTARYMAEFDKLMVSDFRRLSETNSYVISLAERLNPVITLELARLDEEYDRIVDAAFATFAMPAGTTLSVLFNHD